MKTPLQILCISLFLLTGCSSWTSGIVENPTDSTTAKEIPKVSEIQALIENAYSGEVFREAIQYTYSGSESRIPPIMVNGWLISHAPETNTYTGEISKDIFDIDLNSNNGPFKNNKGVPAQIMKFTEYNTGSYIFWRIPYYDNLQTKVWYEYFITCKNNTVFCASFYTTSPRFITYEEWFARILPISGWSSLYRKRTFNSPSWKLSRMLETTKNRYYHGQYSMRLSDEKVISLDPLDTDITSTWALFKRIWLIYQKDLSEATKIIHDRFYLTGGLTKPEDKMKIPTGIWDGYSIPWWDWDKKYYDGYEVQLYDKNGFPNGFDEYLSGVLINHGDVWLANYISSSIDRGSYALYPTMHGFYDDKKLTDCHTIDCPDSLVDFSYP